MGKSWELMEKYGTMMGTWFLNHWNIKIHQKHIMGYAILTYKSGVGATFFRRWWTCLQSQAISMQGVDSPRHTQNHADINQWQSAIGLVGEVYRKPSFFLWNMGFRSNSWYPGEHQVIIATVVVDVHVHPPARIVVYICDNVCMYVINVMYVCMYVCMNVCMYVCIYIYVCMYMYIYIYVYIYRCPQALLHL